MSEPIHIISLGAGVQSSTMALMAALGEITPMPVAAVFADTQAEPKNVYDWLDWLETQLPFPVYRVTSGNMTEQMFKVVRRRDDSGNWSKNLIPAFILNADGTKGIMQRQCTADYKIKPLERAVKALAEIRRGEKQIKVCQWIGISSDETLRMKESRMAWQKHRWPLVEMGITRRRCFEWMLVNGFPTPPRSACTYCPYHSNSEWRRLKEESPAEFNHAVEVEKKLQEVRKQCDRSKGIPFLHASLKPLSEVDFSTEEERGQINMFNNECTGMCGV